jgi:two-component system nitrate/nitrite response regulator NarL
MDTQAQVTIFLVESHGLIRSALVQLLATAGFEVVGEASNGKDAVRKVVAVRPDVVLVELSLPDRSGLETIQRLRAAAPDSRVLVFTDSRAPSRVVEAILAGADGYLLKSAEPEELIRAVRSSAAGQCVVSPQVAGQLFDRIREREIPVTAQNEDAAAAIRAVLSERELEIFKRLAGGGSNHEIGQELSLSEHTIKNHIASILGKLELENRTQAAVHAVRSGIVSALLLTEDMTPQFLTSISA